jgi:RND family efflux transporter MFP subunit
MLITLIAAGAAVFGGWLIWKNYMETAWTRDGTVRAYVVTVTPQVSGKVAQLAVKADQFVKKGDLLMLIEPDDYQIELANADAAVSLATEDLSNKKTEAARRVKLLSDSSVSQETEQTYLTTANMAAATLKQAQANLDKAKLDLQRTRIVSPVDGYVTNLVIQPGDYATSGQRSLSIVDSNSFWVDAYFEETLLRHVKVGDAATVKLMAYPEHLPGKVVGVGRGISVPNADSDASGLATVNPVFTWVRLAQRVPVRVELDQPVPSWVRLAAGLTATVSVEGGGSTGGIPVHAGY